MLKKDLRYWLAIFITIAVVLLIYNAADNPRFNFNTTVGRKEMKLLKSRKQGQNKPKKIPFVILLYTKYFGGKWTDKYPLGKSSCNLQPSYSQCVFTDQLKRIHFSHVVLFHGNDLPSPRDMRQIPRNPHQIWIFMTQENPLTTNTGVFKIKDYDGLFNWTATYHHSSHVITPYHDVIRIKNGSRSDGGSYIVNSLELLMKSKSKLVMGIMSNCVDFRIHFLKNLKKYIDVDLYGRCKNKVNPGISQQCERDTDTCAELQKGYKFFLAIENSFCTDYVTEKLYREALQKELVPIVLNGGKLWNTRIAPPNSFINILDFKSVRHLADYIKYLDGNDTAYLQYHRWRYNYDVVPHNYQCNLCKTLNKKLSNVRRWPPLVLSEKWNSRMCKRFKNNMFQKYLH